MNVGKFSSVVHLVHIEFVARESDIVFDLVAEKEIVLRHVTYGVSQTLDIAIHDIVAVDKHFAPFYVVEMQQRVYKRRFAAAYLAHYADALTGIDGESDVFEHVRFA